MKQSILGILFDVDGTLLNTEEYIFQAFEHAFRHHGLANVPRKTLATLMGTPLEDVYEKVCPTGDATVLSATHREFQRHNENLVQVFPGVVEALKTLHDTGLKLAAVTSRRKQATENMEALGITKHLDFILTAEDVQYQKPHPEGILKVMVALKLKPDETIMVGDAITDVEAGRAAHVKTIGVTWGFAGQSIQRAHPDYVVKDVKEMLSVIQGLL